jgi:hypothetical protein
MRKFSKLLNFICTSRMYLSKWNRFEVSEGPGRDTQVEWSKERSQKKGYSGPSRAGWCRIGKFYEDSCLLDFNKKLEKGQTKLFTAGESQLSDIL